MRLASVSCPHKHQFSSLKFFPSAMHRAVTQPSPSWECTFLLSLHWARVRTLLTYLTQGLSHCITLQRQAVVCLQTQVGQYTEHRQEQRHKYITKKYITAFFTSVQKATVAAERVGLKSLADCHNLCYSTVLQPPNFPPNEAVNAARLLVKGTWTARGGAVHSQARETSSQS